MSRAVVVLDYGSGNLRSAQRALERVGAAVSVTADIDAAAGTIAKAHHGQDFVAAVERGAVSATQFHPEKSGDAGAVLLENWLGTL